MKETPEQLTKRWLDLEDSTNKRIDELDRTVTHLQAMLVMTWGIMAIVLFVTMR